MGEEVIYPQTYAVTPPSASDGPPETELSLLQAILAVLSSGAGGTNGYVSVDGVAQSYDYQTLTYFFSTNNVNTITYRSGGAAGTIVAVTRYNYRGGGIANDDVPVVIATTSS